MKRFHVGAGKKKDRLPRPAQRSVRRGFLTGPRNVSTVRFFHKRFDGAWKGSGHKKRFHGALFSKTFPRGARNWTTPHPVETFDRFHQTFRRQNVSTGAQEHRRNVFVERAPWKRLTYFWAPEWRMRSRRNVSRRRAPRRNVFSKSQGELTPGGGPQGA